MAKRFTDTAKWKRPWFQGLSRDAKLVWIFLCDDCDHAGIWIADFAVMSLRLGMKLDEPKLAELVGDKVVKIDEDKYFIPSFFEYQYGDAKDGFKAKQSALKTLRAWNLLDESDSLKDLTNSYLRVTEQSPDCHIISKSKIIGKGKKGSAEGKPYSPEFEAAWKVYPRKDDKGDAWRAYQANVEPHEQADVPKAIAAYLAKLTKNKTEAKFIKLGATFFNQRRWRDCLEPDFGNSESFAENQAIDWTKFEKPEGAA